MTSISGSRTAVMASTSPLWKAVKASATSSRFRSRSLIDLEHREEGLLGHLDAADLLHALLALLLLFEQFALARDVAAVELRRDVLAQRLDGLAREDACADGGLDRDVEELARNRLLEPLHERLARRIGVVAMDDHRERVDAVAGEQHVELDEVGDARPERLVVERGVAARARLELIVQVAHDLGQRQVVAQLHAD